MIFDSKLQKSSSKLWYIQFCFPLSTTHTRRRYFSKYSSNNKDGEGINKRNCTQDPRTGTRIWGVTEVGCRVGRGGVGKGGKAGTTVIAQTIKKTVFTCPMLSSLSAFSRE